METVDNTLDCSIDDVLDRPLFCFLAMTTDGGQPRLSPLVPLGGRAGLDHR